jgi:microcystin degradation protein MlrC
VRALVGAAVPVVAPLDLHGNLTARMVGHLDFFCGYHENPHTDCFDRGREAFRMLPALLAGAVRPHCALEHVPMLIPPTTTARADVPGRDGAIGADMNAAAAAVEAWPGVLDATVFHGFFKSDTPDVGVHVAVTVDLAAPGDGAALARRGAAELAGWVWARRERFRQKNLSPADAVARAAVGLYTVSGCHFSVQLNHFIPGFLSYSVYLFF